MSEENTIPQNEEKTLVFWQQKDIFKKSLAARKKGKKMVFFEGPPTANGKPGIHHVLGRSFKDMFCRYFSMQGYYIERKAGWDTHGLPVEIEVEKKLGFTSKQDIEKYGIKEFNKKCKESVWTYKDEWERITQRIGFWLDLSDPYVTFENDYIESVWAILKKVWDKKLLYKGHKVVPFCTRCGTALSSHEVAQGYKETTDPSIYVKFKIKGEENTYFLVWTTTPWTLPSNVALAVGEKLEYKKIKIGAEFYYTYLLPKHITEYEIIGKVAGKDLLGKEYEPLYSFIPLGGKKAHYVVGADFVSTEDGTGIVHIAPAFGEDDMNIGKKYDLPVVMTVEESGKFKKEITPWAGIWVKKVDPSIIEELQGRGLMFFSDPAGIKHEYPFCWRCQSPLLYYAKDSWFIKMSALRKQLMDNNAKVNWVPAHLKEGRFGEWLREVKDWALSRERYWATPLPVWECGKCDNKEAVGSIDELEKKRYRAKNRFIIIRHGYSEGNHTGVLSCYPEKHFFKLMPEGEKKLKMSLIKLRLFLKKEKAGPVRAIYASDLTRTRQTAEMAKDILGADVPIHFDERLREVHVGSFNNRPHKEYMDFFGNIKERFSKKPDGGETWNDVKRRMMDFIRAVDGAHKGETIIVVSHGDPIWILDGALHHCSEDEQLAWSYPKTGSWRELDIKNYPYDDDGNLDVHRPYIDEIALKCSKCGGKMQRVRDVIDVWFDSGAMPFAQTHWPFEKKKQLQYPSQFIAEGIDQTRGWFYTLLAIGTLMGRSAPYKTVISYGHVLDKEGKKMSKSKGNIVDPWDAITKFGSDGVRWYFYVVNQAGEPKRFDEKEVMEHVRKFLLLWQNTSKFLGLYTGKKIILRSALSPKNLLDKWIISRLNGTGKEVQKQMNAYDSTAAARRIEEFVDDCSVWYVRRSRKRFQQPKNAKDKAAAQETLAFVLFSLAKMCAPFVPFFSEEMYQQLKKIVSAKQLKESVHLERFPVFGVQDKKLEEAMKKARDIVALGHRLRAGAKIKVRQPLRALYIKGSSPLSQELAEIIADELNVKEVRGGDIPASCATLTEGGVELGLDIAISEELWGEGVVREIVRNIQDARKKMSLRSKDIIAVSLACPDTDEGRKILAVVRSYAATLKKEALITSLRVGVVEGAVRHQKIFVLENTEVTLAIT